MSKLVIETSDYRKVLERAMAVDHAAFYVGVDRRAVTGGRLTASVSDGRVVITSNRLPEGELKEIFADFVASQEDRQPEQYVRTK